MTDDIRTSLDSCLSMLSRLLEQQDMILNRIQSIEKRCLPIASQRQPGDWCIRTISASPRRSDDDITMEEK